MQIFKIQDISCDQGCSRYMRLINYIDLHRADMNLINCCTVTSLLFLWYIRIDPMVAVWRFLLALGLALALVLGMAEDPNGLKACCEHWIEN